MTYILFALFIGVPILEISVFISVGEEIGLNWTLVIVILTAVVGTWMIKRQGLKPCTGSRTNLIGASCPCERSLMRFSCFSRAPC